MADETNAALVTATWNSVTMHILDLQLPAVTRDDDVDNTHTGTGKFRAKVPGERADIGDVTVTAKYDAATYKTLCGHAGNEGGTLVSADFVATLDSGATVTIDDCALKSVEPDTFSDGTAPQMTLVFVTNCPTGGVIPA